MKIIVTGYYIYADNHLRHVDRITWAALEARPLGGVCLCRPIKNKPEVKLYKEIQVKGINVLSLRTNFTLNCESSAKECQIMNNIIIRLIA